MPVFGDITAINHGLAAVDEFTGRKILYDNGCQKWTLCDGTPAGLVHLYTYNDIFIYCPSGFCFEFDAIQPVFLGHPFVSTALYGLMTQPTDALATPSPYASRASQLHWLVTERQDADKWMKRSVTGTNATMVDTFPMSYKCYTLEGRWSLVDQ